MPSNPEQDRREDCRRAVLKFLAMRLGTAHDAGAVRRATRNDGDDFGIEEIEAALAFLTGDNLAVMTESDLGATRYYQATVNGVRFFERGRK